MAQFDLSRRLLLRDYLRARLLLIAESSPHEGIRTLGRWLILGLFNSGEMDTLLEIYPRPSAPPR
ncbi:hypothetical protein BE21_04095 [Sorangium cellulosum]|uniref:Uncharacterized protein n=1 Tax=Sorangium cellulosum TaxID=56 RepID=A0A150TI09_SORCE|nr:hypothetical protein BE21_04095 [Sorangium cellulosum]